MTRDLKIRFPTGGGQDELLVFTQKVLKPWPSIAVKLACLFSLKLASKAPSSWFHEMRCIVMPWRAASIWSPSATSWRASLYFLIPVMAPMGIAIATRIPATSTVMIARIIAGPKMHPHPPRIFLNSFHTGIQPQKRHQERAKANGMTRIIAPPA
jgi:hypothetical protein